MNWTHWDVSVVLTLCDFSSEFKIKTATLFSHEKFGFIQFSSLTLKLWKYYRYFLAGTLLVITTLHTVIILNLRGKKSKIHVSILKTRITRPVTDIRLEPQQLMQSMPKYYNTYYYIKMRRNRLTAFWKNVLH